jgi:hypothetical protein
MNKEKKFELTEGSEYKIYSLGGRDHPLETEGVFRGYVTIGLDENGILIELNHKHGEMAGKTRILPLNAIFAFDILKMEENEKKEDDKGVSHYVG